MKKLTRKQRAEIYLKVAEKMVRCNDWFGLCYMLSNEINENYHYVDMLDIFPEFALFKPDVLEGEKYAWWVNGLNFNAAFYPRLDCMLLCHQMALNP